MSYRFFTVIILITSIYGCGYQREVPPSTITLPSFNCDQNTICIENNQPFHSELLQSQSWKVKHPASNGIAYVDHTSNGVVFAWFPKDCDINEILASTNTLISHKYSFKLSHKFEEIAGCSAEFDCELWFLNNGVIGSLLLSDLKLPSKLKLNQVMPNAVFLGGNDNDLMVKEINGSFTFDVVGNNFAQHIGGLFTIPLAEISGQVQGFVGQS